MTRVEKQISAFLLVVLSLGLIGCSNQGSTSDVIDSAIKGGMSARSEVLSFPNYVDYKVYRDGKHDGIVYYYKVTNDYFTAVRENDREETKALFTSEAPLAEIVDLGIYIRYEFESVDGRKFDFVLTSSDL